MYSVLMCYTYIQLTLEQHEFERHGPLIYGFFSICYGKTQMNFLANPILQYYTVRVWLNRRCRRTTHTEADYISYMQSFSCTEGQRP